MPFSNKSPHRAVCFDFKGVVMDHRRAGRVVDGMRTLLEELHHRGVCLALISRNPVDLVRSTLGPLTTLFGDHIYSGGGSGKLACIREFAQQEGFGDLGRIAFVDDKPANLLPVAAGSPVFVVGFRGSGKYPHTRKACMTKGIPFTESVVQLRTLLMDWMDGR